MKLRTPREKRILYLKTALRWTLYYVLIFFSFVFMTSGTLLKPVILVPIALAIAIDNNQYASVFTGAICGFLIDVACGKLFGYNAVILAFFCIVVSLAFELYLRDKFLNFMAITAVVSYIQCRLDYRFYYKIWDYPNVERIFARYTLRIWVYTVISGVFVFLVFRLINRFLKPKRHLSIEEVITAKNQQNSRP